MTSTSRYTGIGIAGVILAVMAVTANAAVFYVDVEWTGSSNGTATEPYRTLGEAAAVATANGDVVRIAGGVYKSTLAGGLETFGTAGYQLVANVSLYGGYAGWDGSGTAASDFDWTTRTLPDYATINDATMTVVDLGGANSRAFWSTGYYGPQTLHHGMVFRNSKVTQSSYNGGAVSMGANFSACRFYNCLFYNNETTGYGGAVRVTSRSGGADTLRDCVFIDNTAKDGGALAINPGNGSCSMTRVTFDANIATGHGGAVYVVSYTLNSYDCDFLDNLASGHGGAVSGNNSAWLLDGCTVRFNQALDGAAVGRSVYKGVNVSLLNCLITDNTATSSSGFVVLADGADGRGDVNVQFCTIADNTAGGGAIRSNRGISGRNANALVRNNILVHKGSPGSSISVRYDDPTPTVTYNLIEGYATVSSGPGTIGPGNTSGDPLFADAAGGDYRLGSGSPAIDTADPAATVTVDIRGESRPLATGFDMGAYEGAVCIPCTDLSPSEFYDDFCDAVEGGTDNIVAAGAAVVNQLSGGLPICEGGLGGGSSENCAKYLISLFPQP